MARQDARRAAEHESTIWVAWEPRTTLGRSALHLPRRYVAASVSHRYVAASVSHRYVAAAVSRHVVA